MIDSRVAAMAILAVVMVSAPAAQVPAGRDGFGQQTRLPGEVQAPERAPTGAIMGTVVSGTTGQPVDRVRVRLSGAGVRGGGTVYTDDDGVFAFVGLPAGAFTLSGSKTGYVSISYGQDRPNAGRPGTPIELMEGQQIKDLVFELPPGGVITGIVFDEKNRPTVATPVRVMRWTMSNGERTLASAGTAATDDRGIYRVYGLPPGEYVVSALPRNVATPTAPALILAEERMAELQAQGLSGSISIFTPAEVQIDSSDGEDPSAGYAPVFYPGTLDVGNAMTVSLGVSQELGGVDFALQQVPLTEVHGQVLVPPGVNVASITVRLYNVADEIPGVNNRSTRVRNNEFAFANVPPGQYRAVAVANVRTGRGGADAVVEIASGIRTAAESGRLWASEEVSVAGTKPPDVTLVLQPGMVVTGRVAYDGSTAAPQARRIRVTLTPFGQAADAAGASARNATVDENGQFEIDGLVPAKYSVRASGVSGWTLKSANYGGMDVLDFPLEVTPMQQIDNLQVVFTDQRTEVAGMLQDPFGMPTANYTVVVFPAEERYWLPQSRRIQSTRPTTLGQFSFQGLPPGNYRIAAVTDVETGIWYDPTFLRQLAGASLPFSLAEGQSTRQDIRVR